MFKPSKEPATLSDRAHVLQLHKQERAKENLDNVLKSRKSETEPLHEQDVDVRKSHVGVLKAHFELIRLRNLVRVKKP